ncbi:SUKH-4 family immunity protein [Streptomyces sp. NPDC051219]|uniref:SUKH-4 family immunity protein n=1 Tax=Streptomyces sp. NPDC051219 TaxID=3155283 RepID=UPI003440148E
MSSPAPGLPDQLVQHFGRDGLRRFAPAHFLGAHLPEATREFLEATGVPGTVAPYFRSPSAEEPIALGTAAARLSQPKPPRQMERWPRIGGDGLAHVCVRPDGALQAVVLVDVADDMFVNSDLSSFDASLLALDRAQPRLAVSSGLAEAAAVFRDLNEELRGIDASAFAERESWWPRVLDDMRHTLNFPFSAAFEYVDRDGAKHIATEATGPGKLHPEEIVWSRLSEMGVSPAQVRRVYCELEPCLMPGHYCAIWMQTTFPEAEFTHSFDYGDTADTREAGLKELITHAAEQASRQ